MAKPIIVCDIDEVIVNISPKWVHKAIHDKACLLRIRNQDVLITHRDTPDKLNALVLDRLNYNLIEWLKLPSSVHKHFINLYAKDGIFYEGLSLTKFAYGLLSTPQARHVVFISHVISDETEESKRNFMRRYFKNIDYELHTIPRDKKKSEVIASICPNFDVCVDDDVDNLIDMAQYIKEGGYLLAPNTGYTLANVYRLEPIVKEKKLNMQVFE